jgi:hypothetical protein
MYFLLEAKDWNNNGCFLLINLTKGTNLTINQFGHLIKLDLKISTSQIG